VLVVAPSASNTTSPGSSPAWSARLIGNTCSSKTPPPGFGDDVAACSAVYYWPQDQRSRDDNGKLGILHVKCAVADGRWLYFSSANLTEYAFTINMELGVLVTGGRLAARVEAHFYRLIEAGVLANL
jgi:hypothetical protein